MKYFLVINSKKVTSVAVSEYTFLKALLDQTLDLTIVPSKNDPNTVNYFDCGVIFGYSVRDREEEEE